MKNRNIAVFFGLTIAFLILFPACRDNNDRTRESDQEFAEFISAYTSGVISKNSVVKLRLTAAPDSIVLNNKELLEDIFKFEPDVKGLTYWIDKRTLGFKPDESFKSGQKYEVDFNLGRIMKMPSRLEKFRFSFQTIRLSFELFHNIQSEGDKKKYVNLNGNLVSSDEIRDDIVEKMLNAEIDGKEVPVKWLHEDDGVNHKFIIENIERKDAAKELVISWNGDAAEIDQKGSDVIEIPSIGDFKILNVNVDQYPDQKIIISFSDPLDNNQDLRGMVKLNEGSDLRCIVKNNEIIAFPESRETGQKELVVSEGIKNIFDKRFRKTYKLLISFEEMKPAVEFIGEGVIVPDQDGFKVPFRAINLNAVDIQVIRIFEDNIGQFLQTNRFGGYDELKRVGRPVHQKTMKLNPSNAKDLGGWNTYILDLTKLFNEQPGSILRINISFRKEYSLYDCPGSEEEDNPEKSESAFEKYDQEFWDEPGYYSSYYYPDDFTWRERDNPCDISYYYYKNFISKNILASNLGIMAKRGENNVMKVFVTDINTAKPVSDAAVEFYNYQLQLIGRSNTNNEGLVKFNTNTQPFFIKVVYEKQFGFLRVDDGSSLNMSKFDVSGLKIVDGLKGYIYTERGVWRPGDSLFITFILGQQQKLPERHPVIFEMFNPMGQVVNRMVKTESVNGFYKFNTKTDQNAITGNYRVRIKVGGAIFSKRLKIETVKPNRLKVNLDFGTDLITPSSRTGRAKLTSQWLTGAKARNLKAKIEMYLHTIQADFKGFEKYTFYDPSRDYYSEPVDFFDGRTNTEGIAEFNYNFPYCHYAPGMLKANFTSRVFEESGDFSINYFTIKYAPFETFVGIKLPEGNKWGMLQTDTLHTIEVATVDAHGGPVSVKDLKVKVYRVDWRWWWNASDNDIASYFGRSHPKAVVSKSVSTQNGKGSFKLEIEDEDWGRYFIHVIDEQDGHATGKTCYFDWPGWYGRSSGEDPQNASMLIIETDKSNYETGDICKVTFPSASKGRALVSLENGSKVLESYWVNVQEKQTRFSFKITEDMAPNAYLNITYLQPYKETKNGLPIRMYGVIPIFVENPETVLHPEIDMPAEIKPEESVTVEISEKNNKPMTYTIAVVDEGLLDLTNFKTPDPWNYFYSREALGVKSWDMFSYVMGAYGGSFDQMFAIGGGGMEEEGPAKKDVNRFKPVVIFMGPYELEEGDEQEHTFQMPDYVGSVRTMVVAGNERAFGSAQETTPVKKPLMVLATLPRVLGPEEEVVLPVTVFAMDDHIHNVKVSIETNDMLICNQKNKQITFSETGDKVVNFYLDVAPQIGIGKVTVEAESGGEKATAEIEIQVRNSNPPVTRTINGVVQAGETWMHEYEMPGISGTNSGTFEVSDIPSIKLQSRLKYLIRYPYGCGEQVTSAVFPQIYLGQVLSLDQSRKKKISENVRSGINKLKSYQLTNGGIGYWRGATYANDWLTSYVGHFMLEAWKKGYLLPLGFREQWLNYQKNAADQWDPEYSDYRGYYRQNDLVQAYRLFTLALSGEPRIGAMNRLREYKKMSKQSAWMLAGAYYLIGQKEVAENIVSNLSTKVEEYSGMTETFGSSLRDEAFILYVLSLMDDKTGGLPVMKNIAGKMGSHRWYSTQTTAFCLVGIAEFIGNDETDDKSMNFEYTLNDSGSEEINSSLPVYNVDLNENIDKGNVKLSNKGNGTLFSTITMSGIPVIGDQTTEDNNLIMEVKYTDINGRSIDIEKLPQGTDFLVSVKVSNPGMMGNYANLALNQIFPSGWEISNTRLSGFNYEQQGSIPDYQDIRDDRVYTFFDLPADKSKTFVIALNATYLGRFYLPSVYCEAMYDHSINSVQAGKWVEVVEPWE